MGNAVKVLLHGVDTLFVNAHLTDGNGHPVKTDLPDSLATQLERWKREAQEAGEAIPCSWVFNEKQLKMYPNGAGRGHWQWLLRSDDLALCISRGKWNGGIAQVRLASEYLWKFPLLMDAVIEVHSFLYELFERDVLLQPSEVHLCVDVTGWHDVGDLDFRRLFVSRSRVRGDYNQGGDGGWQEGCSANTTTEGLLYSHRGKENTAHQ